MASTSGSVPRQLLLPLVMISVGAALFAGGLLTPWKQGNPVPYAPGEDQASALAAAKTAQGYTSDIVTVYEGVVSNIDHDVRGSVANSNYHVVLASGAPSLYVLQDQGDTQPPTLTIGEEVRIWSVMDLDASGKQQRFAVRLEAPGVRWLSGLNRYRMPIEFEGGTSPAVSALALAGVPLGILVGLSGGAVLYRRAKPAPRLRTPDHVAIWSAVVAISSASGLLEFVRVTGTQNLEVPQGLFPLVVLVAIVGFIAGVAGLISRKPGDPWLPAAIGIVLGVALLLLAGFEALVVFLVPL